MKVPVFSYTRKGKLIRVFKSFHVNEKRGDSWYSRDTYIDEKRYREIVEIAFQQGLTEFKDKGAVAVCFYDDLGYKHTLLINLNDKGSFYEVFVISAIYSKKYLEKSHYVKCHNRLNIWNWYTMKSMTKEEKDNKMNECRALNIEKSSRKEDDVFIGAMTGVKRLQRYA